MDSASWQKEYVNDVGLNWQVNAQCLLSDVMHTFQQFIADVCFRLFSKQVHMEITNS